jgi:serine/threonine protein kinase
MSAGTLLAPGTRVDRYVVVDHLGSGGIASVYRVRHSELDTELALKVVHGIRGDASQRLRREGKALAKLQHPGIVGVRDLLDVDGKPALLMELVDGPTLRELFDRGPVSRAMAEDLAVQLMVATEAAHAAGFVHRDLKPENVLLSEIGIDSYQVKIADFGLVKTLRSSEDSVHTPTGVLMGTPNYMAPEQITKDHPAGPWTDVWALGAMMYEMFVGARAFPQTDLLHALTAVREGRWDRQALNGIPSAPRRAIEGAMTHHPEQRVRGCAELLALWKGDNTHQIPAADTIYLESFDHGPVPQKLPWRPIAILFAATATALLFVFWTSYVPIQTTPTAVVGPDVERARRAYLDAQFDDAARLATLALKQNPDNPLSTLILADSSYFNGDQPRAQSIILGFRPRLDATDSATNALVIKAEALRKLDVTDKVRRHLEDHPEDIVSLLSLTWVNDRYIGPVFDGQNHGIALELVDKAIEQHPEAPVVFVAGWRFAAYDEERFLNEGLTRHPTNLALLRAAADNAIIDGDVQRLAELVALISDHHVGQSVVQLQLAVALFEGDHDRQNQLTKAIDLLPYKQRVEAVLQIAEHGCMVGQREWTYDLTDRMATVARDAGDQRTQALVTDLAWGCASFFEDIPDMQKYAKATEALAAAPELDTATKEAMQIDALYQAALIAALTGDLKTAQANYDRLSEFKRPNPTLLMTIQLHSGELTEPVPTWQKMPCFGPYAPAQINIQAGFLDTAEEQLKLTLEGDLACHSGLFSIRAAVQASLAEIAQKRGRRKAAVAYAQEALALVPGGDDDLPSTVKARAILAE